MALYFPVKDLRGGFLNCDHLGVAISVIHDEKKVLVALGKLCNASPLEADTDDG